MKKNISKAEQIRRMFDQGIAVAEIARVMGVRYQHAYNVITEYVRKQEILAHKQAAASKEREAK